jgi:hypothetical protein
MIALAGSRVPVFQARSVCDLSSQGLHVQPQPVVVTPTLDGAEAARGRWLVLRCSKVPNPARTR